MNHINIMLANTTGKVEIIESIVVDDSIFVGAEDKCVFDRTKANDRNAVSFAYLPWLFN